MGAWGPLIFENDISMDWIDDLTECNDVTPVISVLSAVANADDSEYIDNALGWPALCAAEVVAASLGYPSEDFPAWASEWLARNRVHYGMDEATLALKAVNRVCTNSEVIESGLAEDSEWNAIIADLKERLSRY